MGGAVSSGENNGELVDNLCSERYIVTPEVERVFRIVDRKDYMIFDEEDSNPLEAYEDHAWRCGNLHLSAPCIYTKAMESLKLSRGLSFLNIGSGTGYFSTMVGLILGSTGINHGIELYPDNVEFAYEHLKCFKETSPWYDPVEFCEPYFVVGNALLMSPSGMLYDRIYCGASCPLKHVQLLKNLLKRDGILVVPCGNCLDAITRTQDHEWKVDTILSTVSFAPLILPSVSNSEDMTAINITSSVGSLRELCRLSILMSLGRDRYQSISSLPLPVQLQSYVGLNRKWELPANDIKILCPIEDGIELSEEQNENDEAVKGKANLPSENENGRKLTIKDLGIGRRSLIVNINGMYIQLPIEGSDSESTQSGDEVEEHD